jgi:hypothetical protein
MRSGRLFDTSGVSRLAWGIGSHNRYNAGTVSLACLTYRPSAHPEVRRRVEPASESPGAGERDTDIVTYQPPDYMLSSAQDYRAGERGNGEHVWQATLGPDALVFVTHPANASERAAHEVGFWCGNAVLPRVAQWKDALITVHRLPEDDWMGYTHAHFATHAFGEHALRDGWAFARVGDGYLALTAALGFELQRSGPSGYREQRSYGRENVWLVFMGRAETDGSFEAFQHAVLGLDVDFRVASVRACTPRGERLS